MVTPIALAGYPSNPIRVVYTFAGLSTPPTVTATLKKDANGLPLAGSLQPSVTVSPDALTAGQYVAEIITPGSASMPLNSFLEISVNGRVFAAGPVTVSRSQSGQPYNAFINTVNLVSESVGGVVKAATFAGLLQQKARLSGNQMIVVRVEADESDANQPGRTNLYFVSADGQSRIATLD